MMMMKIDDKDNATTMATILKMMMTMPMNNARAHAKYTRSFRAACAKLTKVSLIPVSPARLASRVHSLLIRRFVAKWRTGHALATGV